MELGKTKVEFFLLLVRLSEFYFQEDEYQNFLDK